MRRCLLVVGLLCWTAALMGADFKASQIQLDMAELLNLNFGLERMPNPEPGAEYSFVVTDEAIKAMKNLKESGLPVEIASGSEQATKKSDIFKALGFIPREQAAATEQPVFKLDVTDVTLMKLRGKTLTILADGTVKLKTTR